MQVQEYQQMLEEGNQFLDQHIQLLQSLALSKQNAGNNYTEGTQEVGNDSIQSGQGISQPSNQLPT